MSSVRTVMKGEPMSLINREDLIAEYDRVYIAPGIARKLMEDAPTVEPERKTGEWIQPKGMMPPEHHGHYECSECGAWAGRNWLRPWKEIQLSNYCPNCGVPMTDEEGAQP